MNNIRTRVKLLPGGSGGKVEMLISEALLVFDTYYLVNENKSEKTRKEYRDRIHGRNGLLSVIGDIPVGELGIDHIVRWKVHQREQGLKPSYINHQLSEVRWFLKWLSENEFRVLDWRLITFEKEPKDKPHTVLSLEEVQSLIDFAKTPRDKAIIELFFGTGIRSAELISIDRWEWEGAELINESEVAKGAEPIWEIYVLGKNKKHRPVLFYQYVKDRVDEYLETRTDRFKPLFISLQNRRIHWNTVGKMLHEASRRAGLTKRVTQHVLRHSYATENGANGMPMPVLAYNLGHSNAATTAKIYTHINAIHARRAYAVSHPRAGK